MCLTAKIERLWPELQGGTRAPAAPPKPDADDPIWHKRPGYPNREVSEPAGEKERARDRSKYW